MYVIKYVSDIVDLQTKVVLAFLAMVTWLVLGKEVESYFIKVFWFVLMMYFSYFTLTKLFLMHYENGFCLRLIASYFAKAVRWGYYSLSQKVIVFTEWIAIKLHSSACIRN